MRSAKEKEEFRQLHAAYREAWRRFASKVDFWHLLVSMMHADNIALAVAADEIRLAELEYRTKRNLLADFMLARSTGRAVVNPRRSCECDNSANEMSVAVSQ